MAFIWNRPKHLPYPNVWLKFNINDAKTGISEYTVEDLPEDRFDEAIELMVNGFLAAAPMAKWKNAVEDKSYIEDNTQLWKIILRQRMSHMCLENGSDEIVGLCLNYVTTKNDAPLLGADIKSEGFLQNIRVYNIVQEYGRFDVFEKYGVDKYLSALGMYVPQKFAGRKIGEKLLEASKCMAKPCEIKLRHAFFSSNISNKIADNLGYKTDVELSFEEIQRIDPSLELGNIESSKATLRTWIFEE